VGAIGGVGVDHHSLGDAERYPCLSLAPRHEVFLL